MYTHDTHPHTHHPTIYTISVPQLNVSYKPQKISPKFPGTVRELLHAKIREAYGG
jgi:translation initiation factor RLI1